jgi:hypothetical protein
MNGIEHTFPVSEEVSHNLDNLKDELISKPAVAEVTRTVTGSKKTMNTIAIFAGLLALVIWLRD